MNKQKHYLNLAILLMAGLAIAGCQEDEVGGFTPAAPGDAIEFAVNAVKTRTAYVSDNQIDWTGGENIRIYSDVADKKDQSGNNTPGASGGWINDAVYTVTPAEEGGVHEYHGNFTAVGETYLAWSGISNTHEFYGIYPNERLNYDGSTPKNGSFQLQYITNQKCKVTTEDNNYYIAEPDMLNAYMVAHNTVERTKNHVLLDFDPIMTTLDITIKAGGYEVATGIIQPLTVTGVSVTLPAVIGKDYFTYNASNIQNSTEAGSSGQGELQEELRDGSESVFISFTDKSGNPMNISLSEGDSIKLTAFLPPIPTDKTSQAQIKVHTLENFKFVATLNKPLQAQYKIEIPLPDVKPDSPKNTNWISELDGDSPLTQMSIIGVRCSENTSAETINKLLDMGVRSFDVEELMFWHVGVPSYNAIPEAIVNTFKSFLEENKDEFLIVYSDKALKTDFEEYNVPIYELKTDNVSTVTVTDMRGKIVTAWKGTNYFVQNDKSENGLFNLGKLFPHKDYHSSSEFPINPKNWNDWGKDKDGSVKNWGEQCLDSSDKTVIYNQIAKYNEQRGYTGIVTLENVDTSGGLDSTDEQLIQAIINCNFRFISDKQANKQQQ